jgi:hypothetical protein
MSDDRPRTWKTPGPGREVKLPPFEAPRANGGKGRKTGHRHLRAADGPHWTPTELYRRNAALKKTLGMESCKANTPEYDEGFAQIDWAADPEPIAPREVEVRGPGRVRYTYGESPTEVKR